MSLYGALFSGVSGLTAQSSAMAAISDNITNVNTIGYKSTNVAFSTLVTKQTSSTQYSAGGVTAAPSQGVGVQGLLQASTSLTDIAISGNGFFVVNESANPDAGDQYAFTRAGSFTLDDEGYLVNTSGYYLMGWPTDASGNVIPANDSLAIANQNIISSDYVEAINLNRVGGTAAATSLISIGANLPANADEYDSSLADPTDQDGYQKTDVQFYDTLGNAHTISFEYLRSDTANEWGLVVEPPSGTAYLTLNGIDDEVYDSIGQLEFTSIPQAGQTIDIGGVTYTFVSGTPATANEIQIDGGAELSDVVSDLVTAINANDPDDRARLKAGTSTTLILDQSVGGTALAVSGIQNLTDANGKSATLQGKATDSFTLPAQTTAAADHAIEFDATGQPSAINVTSISVFDFTSGAADMDNTDINGDGVTDVERIALDFGTIGEADGMTQYGDEFTPGFIEQNGSQFGVLSSVSIDENGLVTALFDNGETRTIYKIPVATFVNVNSLESLTGNVWIATEASGDYTLREATSGTAGTITQGALESSTVDIGEEFSKMIVVQRAYSAASKIISTADDMLEELMSIKR